MNYELQQLGSLQSKTGSEHFPLYYCDQQSDLDYLRGKTSSFMLYDIKRWSWWHVVKLYLNMSCYWTYAKGRQREEDSKPYVTSGTIILFKDNFRQLLRPFKRSFVNDQNTVILIEHRNLHAGNRPVMFVTHKRSDVLFFVPSCCVSSLLTCTKLIGRNHTVFHFCFGEC